MLATRISLKLGPETQSSPEKPNNKFKKSSNTFFLIKLKVGP